MKLKNIVLICCAFLFPIISSACDLCGCYMPKDNATKGFQFGIAEQYSQLSDLYSDGQQLTNEQEQFLNSSYTQILASYRFNERYGLQLNVPFVYRSFQRTEGDSIKRGNLSGIGDIFLIGYYAPFQRKTPFAQFTWKVLGGLKFPTGNSDRIGEELLEGEGEEEEGALQPSGVHGHDITLGSGSWDTLIGTDIYGRRAQWFYSGHLQYVIRTRGDFDYRFANDLLWDAGAGYYLKNRGDWIVGLQGLFTGEHKGEDQLGSEKTDDTAITSVYFGPAATIGIKRIAMAEIGIGFPLKIENSGLQTVPRYRLRAGITWQFR